MERQAQIRIDVNSPEPVVRQVVAQIRTLVVEGALLPGAPLPSVRRLATDLAVHFNTVAEAYRILAEEGWLEVSHGRGARVVDRRPPEPTARAMASLHEKLRHVLAEMKAAGMPASHIRKELLAAIEVLEK